MENHSSQWPTASEEQFVGTLEATHENTLKIVPFELLVQYAVIPNQLH